MGGNRRLRRSSTPFNGSLTLPPAMIASLGLQWRTRGLVMLANGTEDYCDIYVATIIWDGSPRNILLEAPTPILSLVRLCRMVMTYTCR